MAAGARKSTGASALPVAATDRPGRPLVGRCGDQSRTVWSGTATSFGGLWCTSATTEMVPMRTVRPWELHFECLDFV